MENLEKCILESERLWIRPVSISDAEALCPEYKVVAVNIRKSKGKYKEQV